MPRGVLSLFWPDGVVFIQREPGIQPDSEPPRCLSFEGCVAVAHPDDGKKGAG